MAVPRIIGLVAENSPDFVARAFDCWAQGRPFVVLRSETDRDRIDAVSVSEVVVPRSGAGWLDVKLPLRNDDAVAQVMFTSGTEGAPKGVLLTHGNLADVVERLTDAMQLGPEIREYVGVPVYHSFGFGRCRAVSRAGGRVYLPARSFDPLEIGALLNAGEINAISAVPSLWRILLLSRAIGKSAAARVRWIEIGSQFMSGTEKLQLRQHFPNAIIIQHYGLTEASRTTFLEVHRESEERLESVGRPWGNVEVRLTADGLIQIRGPHTASQLLVAGEYSDPRSSDGWLTTNDRGEMRDGLLHYLGRADDVINCGGLKLAPDAIEAAISQRFGPGLQLAICRIPDLLRGDGILVAATHDVDATDAELCDSVAGAALALGVNARGAIHTLRLDRSPGTDTGKVKRRELAAEYTRLHAADEQQSVRAAAAGPGTKASLREGLGAILGVMSVADRDTFVHLGGDSLRFIQACVLIHRQLGYLPDGWETLPIAELEALPPRIESFARVEPSVFLRALAITSVITNHAGVLEPYFVIDGAAMALLMPSGYSFARFQLQRVLESNKASNALAGLSHIVVPTFLLLLAQQLRHHEFVPSVLLFFNNFVRSTVSLDYWFIQLLVQIQVLLALTLSVPWVRQQLRTRPFVASACAAAICTALHLLGPLVWDTNHLFNLVPHMLLWHFAIGACVYFARNLTQRLIVTGFILISAAVELHYPSKLIWLAGGGLLLTWGTAIPLPKGLVRVVTALASASLYIYLIHPLILHALSRFLPGPAQVIAVLLIGVAFWYASERAWTVGRRIFSSLTEPRNPNRPRFAGR